jgi:gamma-glutamyltranspeptidase/glutathione hydrolase
MLAHALLMMERAGLETLREPDSNYMHLLLEVLKVAFDTREKRYGDPNFVDVGLDEVLSAESIARCVKSLDRNLSSTRAAARSAGAGEVSMANPDTSYVCVVDRWGNSFSATPSDRSFTAPVVPGTGIVPSTRGEQARPDPTHPSGVAPGKRPRLTPNPALSVRDDGSVMVFGSPGGDMQVQAMLQVFLNIFHFGMDVQDAIEEPRISTWSFPGSFSPYQRRDNLVAYEARIPPDVLQDLESRGHDLQSWPAYARTAGAVEVITREGASGLLRAGADPRRPTAAIVS